MLYWSCAGGSLPPHPVQNGADPSLDAVDYKILRCLKDNARQKASAISDARKMIVDGAVGMEEMALERLEQGGTVQLDDERKAAMVSNLLVVLCGNRDAQPIVNSGSLN